MDLDDPGLRKFMGTILPTQIYENPWIYLCYALINQTVSDVIVHNNTNDIAD